MRLKNRVAVVTGGSRGIGQAIALALGVEGANAALTYRIQNRLAAEVVEGLRGHQVESEAFQLDVRDAAQVLAVRDAILERFGQVDILVANAGINQDRTLQKMDEESWEAVIEVNLSGVFRCARAFAPQMIDRGYGRIILLSSIIGQRGNFGQTNYAASKAGIIGFTKSLARELATKGITVNAVAPGFIDTEMVRALSEEVRQRLIAQIPVGRFGTPQEVARLVTFLASEEASYITGQVININGGMYM